MASPLSARLILSYVLDWVVIIAIAGAGAGFSSITPNKRPFNLTDPTIAFPYVAKEKISSAVLVVIGLIVPAAIIFVTALFIGLGPSTEKSNRTLAFKRKLWEWNAGWMGLALALAVAFFITDGTKNLVGKPRPDLLSRCDPDLSQLLNSTVGGIGGQVDEGVNLVSWTICKKSGDTLDDGFRSFPSGHASFSFAGLTYLALFLCAKLAITIPFLSYHPLTTRSTPARSQAAAAPIYLLIIPLIPICAAIYISSTRFSDFYHHGFDIIAGAILGIASAWLGFRWYHLPISRGGGWAWAPRSPQRAFMRGMGVLTYADEDEMVDRSGDIESGAITDGAMHNGNAGEATPFQHQPQHPTSSDTNHGLELNDLSSVTSKGAGRESESSRMPLR